MDPAGPPSWMPHPGRGRGRRRAPPPAESGRQTLSPYLLFRKNPNQLFRPRGHLTIPFQQRGPAEAAADQLNERYPAAAEAFRPPSAAKWGLYRRLRTGSTGPIPRSPTMMRYGEDPGVVWLKIVDQAVRKTGG